MKTAVIIINGRSTIKLTPENVFEERLIEDAHKNRSDKSTSVSFWHQESQFGVTKDHYIELSIQFETE